jgi:hypothetical protein
MSATATLYRRGQWQIDEDGSESCVDIWRILTTSETDTLTTVLAASGLPAKGASHSEKTNAIVTDITCDHDAEVLTVWMYHARYSTKLKTREDKPFDEQRIKGGMRSASKDVPAFFDARGYPLVNTAGDLYPGLSRKRRLRTVPVTYNFSSIPDWLFELSDTLNNANVTIHGKVYPAGTCKLHDIDMPDEPSRDNDVPANLYWPITYSITIDPDGWYILLPNKGPNELVYQTRASTSPPNNKFADVSKATYDAEANANLKTITKVRIQSAENQDLGDDIWLDANGQAQRLISLRTTQLGTGGMTAGSATLTLASGTFDTTGLHKGALVRVAGCGPKGRWLTARIDTVGSSTSATLSTAAATTASGKAVWVSGALVNYFVMDDLADWSAVPLPNNHP